MSEEDIVQELEARNWEANDAIRCEPKESVSDHPDYGPAKCNTCGDEIPPARRVSALQHTPSCTTGKLLELCALARCSSYAGISPPFEAGTLLWNGQQFIYISGRDINGKRRLLKVFQKTQAAGLQPVMAKYPPPIRDLFKEDYDLLFERA